MAAWVAAACAILLSCCYLSLAQSPSSAPAMAPSVGSEIPTLRIQSRIPLPSLPILQDSYTLNIGISRIVGPGDNTSADDPYVEYTGRTYNHLLVPGLVRVKQGGARAGAITRTFVTLQPCCMPDMHVPIIKCMPAMTWVSWRSLAPLLAICKEPLALLL